MSDICIMGVASQGTHIFKWIIMGIVVNVEANKCLMTIFCKYLHLLCSCSNRVSLQIWK